VLTGDGRRLAQISEVSRPTLHLKSVLVERVKEDRKVQRQQPDGGKDESDDAEVKRAMVVVVQKAPVQVMQKSTNGSTGPDQITPTIRYGVPTTTVTTISSPIVTWNPNSRRNASSTPLC
jgi:hypothetical protein